MENATDTDYDNIEFENHPIIRLMMRSIQMIPSNNDILQSTFDEQTIKYTPTCNKFIENLNEINITEEHIVKKLACSICQEEFKLNDKCIELPCKPHKHYFHTKNENCDGILPWLSQNNTCPMCRYEFPKAENTDENTDENMAENTDENMAENTDENTTENTTENTPIQIIPNIEELLLQAINNTNGQNIINNLSLPNITFDTVRDGFSDREVDEAIRRSLEN